MKNKKGFTIVELVIVFIILIAIGLIIGTNLNGILNKNDDKAYEEFVAKVTGATDVYLSGNTSLAIELETNKGYLNISVKTLKEEGLIEKDLLNPQTGEVIFDNEQVLVSLDANGLVKFSFPGVLPGEYLQTLNKYMSWGDSIECFGEDLNTINLGLIDSNGNLMPNYFSYDSPNPPEKITCDSSKVDSRKVGTYNVTYTYINQAGVSKEANRVFIVVDNIEPRIENIKYSPITWTNGKVTISANIYDDESGIEAYSINKDGCGSYIKTTSNTISADVSSSGNYFICTKDKSGNEAKQPINITNIDTILPTIDSISKSTESWTTSLTLSVSIGDLDSGISAYAINQSNNVNNINWTTISAAKNKSFNQTITASGTYYIWIKDLAGNVNSRNININNIDTTPPSAMSVSLNLGRTDATVKITAGGIEDLSTPVTYKYYLNNTLKGTGTNTEYQFKDLSANVTYTYKIEAINAAGLIQTAQGNILIVPDTDITAAEKDQTYEVKSSGYYQIEAWGSQGASSGGAGGYIKGEIYLNNGDILTIRTGTTSGYNGGGTGTSKGGGATTITYKGSNILVAAGGGGGAGGGIGGTGNGAGGANVGAGAGGNGSNGGGGGSSPNYSYDCNCKSTCGGECKGYTNQTVCDTCQVCSSYKTVSSNCREVCTGSCYSGMTGGCYSNCTAVNPKPGCGFTMWGVSCCLAYGGTMKTCSTVCDTTQVCNGYNNVSCNCRTQSVCSGYNPTYSCNCSTCTTTGKAGTGGNNSNAASVTNITKNNGVQTGNGKVSIKFLRS